MSANWSDDNGEAAPVDLHPAKRRRTNASSSTSAPQLPSADKTMEPTSSTKNRSAGKGKGVSVAKLTDGSDHTTDGARRSARRASGRLRAARTTGHADAVERASENAPSTAGEKQASMVEEMVDSAYGSKEDSLVEDVPLLDGEDDNMVIMGNDVLRQQELMSMSEQSTTSMEVPETPKDQGPEPNTRRKNVRNVSRAETKTSTRRSSGAVTAVVDCEAAVSQNHPTSTRQSVSARKNASPKKSAATASNSRQNSASEGTALVVAESEDELQVEGTTPVRIPSSRSKRRPRRYSIESQSTREPTPVQPLSKKAASNAVSSPQPRGILTPSKGRRNTQRKSVVFNPDEKQIEDQLGFKDIDSSTQKKRKSTRPSEVASYAEDDEVTTVGNPAPGTSSEADHPLDFDQPFDILQSVEQTEILPTIEAREDTPAIAAIKARILSQLTSRLPCPPAPHLSSQRTTLVNLLRSTVVSGESNSLLMLGPRGAGKTLLLEHVLKELNREYPALFHTVRLNGFFQTDDRLALREIWRQLGRETQALADDEDTGNAGNTLSYADTLASLLSLLSHPDEMDLSVEEQGGDAIMTGIDGPSKTAKSTIIILDEFDLFTLHARQTLLYNLFDIAQSRKAPIAVIGCSTRMDIVESLEKRVKSRFSHRWLHVPPVRTLAEMTAVVERALTISSPAEIEDKVDQMPELDETEVGRWNECVKKAFLPSSIITHLISQTFHTTKSIPDLLTALSAPIATLSLPWPGDSLTTAPKSTPSKSQSQNSTSTQPTSAGLSIIHPPLQNVQHTILQTALSLPLQHLTLLAALLSPSYPSPLPSFHTTYTHYQFLLSRTKLLSSSGRASLARSTGPAAGLRQWGRAVCQDVWEELVRWGILGVVGGGKSDGVGAGADGMVDDWQLVRIEVDEEEVLWVLKTRQGRGEGGGLGVLAGWVRGDVV